MLVFLSAAARARFIAARLGRSLLNGLDRRREGVIVFARQAGLVECFLFPVAFEVPLEVVCWTLAHDSDLPAGAHGDREWLPGYAGMPQCSPIFRC